MLKNTIYYCPKCGSKHTELRNTPPKKGFLCKLIAEISELSSVFQRKAPLAGRYYLVCKDCGYMSVFLS